MPTLLISMFFGNALGRVFFSRAVMLLALWFAPPFLVCMFVQRNLPEKFGLPSMIVTALLMLAFALYRPNGSQLKLALLDGVFIWCRLAAFGYLAMTLIGVFATNLAPSRLGEVLRFALPGLAAWAFARWLDGWVARDLDRDEVRSGRRA